MNKNFIYLAFSLIILFSSANAFMLSGSMNGKGDCFNPAAIEFTVINNTNHERVYTIQALEENADWININSVSVKDTKLVFALKQGEGKKLYGFIKPACSTEPGTYIIPLRINEGSEPSLRNVSIDVLDARNVILALEKLEETVSQCEKIEFPLTIKNNSKGNETIEMLVDGIPKNWAAFTETFELEKGKTADKTLWILPPCDAKVKEYNLKITARIKGTNFYDEKEAKFAIKDMQSVSIEGGDFTACNELAEEAFLSVANTGLKADKLHFTVEGLENASAKAGDIELNPDEGITLKIVFDKVKGVGKSKFIFKVQSLIFGKEYTKTFNLNKENCFDASVTIKPFLKISIAAGKERVDKIKIRNTGTRANTIAFEAEGIEWVTAIPKSVDLMPNELAEFFIYYNPPMDLKDGNFTEKIKLKGKDVYQAYNVAVNVKSKETEKQQAVQIDSEIKEISKDNKVTVILLIKNDSNRNILVKNIYAEDLNAIFDPVSVIVPKNSSKEIKLTIYVDELEDLIKVPLKIDTDKGLIEKELEIDTKKGTMLSAGLFNLGNTYMLAGIVSVLVIILVLLLFYVKAKKAEKKRKSSSEITSR